jgi:hypothetical protein
MTSIFRRRREHISLGAKSVVVVGLTAAVAAFGITVFVVGAAERYRAVVDRRASRDELRRTLDGILSRAVAAPSLVASWIFTQTTLISAEQDLAASLLAPTNRLE